MAATRAPIEAYARLKPASRQNHQVLYSVDQACTQLSIHLPKDLRRGTVANNAQETHAFRFTGGVFPPETSQEEVFERVAAPVIESCLAGYNGTIFAYGQTGSGKTYTMSGGDSWEERGVIPRAFTRLFERLGERQGQVEYQVYASYLEIYNENGFDLLERAHAEKPFEKWNKISLFEDQIGNLHLKNLSIHACNSEEQAIDLLMTGNFIRQVAATPMNQASSRSHCIFTLAIEGRDYLTDVITTSKLHLVDLAGSERVYKAANLRDSTAASMRKEAKYINRSLSYLEQVIIALHDKARGSRAHVPYRNSMMTSILRDSLGGNCRTVMIANMSTDIANEEETVSTARFALRCQKLVNQLYKNVHLDTDLCMQKLQAENRDLRQAIEKQDFIIKQQSDLLRMIQQAMLEGSLQQRESNGQGLGGYDQGGVLSAIQQVFSQSGQNTVHSSPGDQQRIPFSDRRSDMGENRPVQRSEIASDAANGAPVQYQCEPQSQARLMIRSATLSASSSNNQAHSAQSSPAVSLNQLQLQLQQLQTGASTQNLQQPRMNLEEQQQTPEQVLSRLKDQLQLPREALLASSAGADAEVEIRSESDNLDVFSQIQSENAENNPIAAYAAHSKFNNKDLMASQEVLGREEGLVNSHNLKVPFQPKSQNFIGQQTGKVIYNAQQCGRVSQVELPQLSDREHFILKLRDLQQRQEVEVPSQRRMQDNTGHDNNFLRLN